MGSLYELLETICQQIKQLKESGSQGIPDVDDEFNYVRTHGDWNKTEIVTESEKTEWSSKFDSTGGTLTGNVELDLDTGSIYYKCKNTDTGDEVCLLIGSGVVHNKGIWDGGDDGYWIICSNGTDTTISKWKNIGNNLQPVYFDASGKPVAGATLGTTTVNSITNVGTLPSFSATVSNETLSFNFSRGTLPTKGSNTAVATITE